MILDVLLGIPIALATAVVELLPAYEGAEPLPIDVSGFSAVLGSMMLLDVGLPISEFIVMMGVLIGAYIILDGFIVLRAMARWLPSWLTGGG